MGMILLGSSKKQTCASIPLNALAITEEVGSFIVGHSEII
jgi:hypothetical protein